MNRFLVTGGAGFIGSNIVERLLKDGHFVRVLDNLSSGKLENLSFIMKADSSEVARMASSEVDAVSRYEFLHGDIRDKSICDKACQGIDYVLHQAALRSVPKSLEIPYEFNAVNIDGTLNLLRASLENKVKRFVFASSSSIYGETDSFPEKEEDPPRLISPYALTKLAGEYYCRIFSENFDLETVSLRYFNVFGPRQAVDDEYSVVIPKFINCILNNQAPPVHGSGRQTRDFTYIDNVVEANILAATVAFSTCGVGTGYAKAGSLPAGGNPATVAFNTCGVGTSYAKVGSLPAGGNRLTHEVFNVANGKDHTVLQLVDSLNKIIGKNIKPAFLPVRAGDVFRTLADISKIKAKLGYEPKVDFEEGLRRTVEWFIEGTNVHLVGGRGYDP